MDNLVSGFIFDIKKFAIHDGPGIRTTIFMKGCPLQCWWCHNPESRKLQPQKILNNITDKEEMIGREITIDELIQEIEKDVIFYDESEGGVTISGGEPFSQPEFLKSLLKECNRRGIHTTVDTCGHYPKELLAEIDQF
ncbi:MAG: 4Fe-4S cluster-binding domain-containing protein, partial [Candidatus Kariarchaeaceae archaeon]